MAGHSGGGLSFIPLDLSGFLKMMFKIDWSGHAIRDPKTPSRTHGVTRGPATPWRSAAAGVLLVALAVRPLRVAKRKHRKRVPDEEQAAERRVPRRGVVPARVVPVSVDLQSRLRARFGGAEPSCGRMPT